MCLGEGAVFSKKLDVDGSYNVEDDEGCNGSYAKVRLPKDIVVSSELT